MHDRGISDRTVLDKKDSNNVCPQPAVFSSLYSTEFRDMTSNIHEYLPVLNIDTAFSEILKYVCRCVAKKAPTLGTMLSPTLIHPLIQFGCLAYMSGMLQMRTYNTLMHQRHLFLPVLKLNIK